MFYLLFIFAPIMIIGLLAQRNVKGTFDRWSRVPSATNQSGAEVARAILDRNGLQDVEVLHTPGELSDHYDPRNRTVNLSDSVYAERSVAAVSVAAHEVGHAIQHQQSYVPLAFRSALFPIASLGTSAFSPLLIIGFLLYSFGSVVGGFWVMLAAIALFAFGVLFQLVTLPVEFDASRRAKAQLQSMTLVPGAGEEAAGTAKVLTAAALTYVVAAAAAVVTLAYYAYMFLGSRN